MITSNGSRTPEQSDSEARKRIPDEIGQLMDSVIISDNLATIHHSEIDQIISTFPAQAEIDAALRSTLVL